MNKRARLTRRILREHRQGYVGHFWINPDGSATYWGCTHCSFYTPQWVPVAYR